MEVYFTERTFYEWALILGKSFNEVYPDRDFNYRLPAVKKICEIEYADEEGIGVVEIHALHEESFFANTKRWKGSIGKCPGQFHFSRKVLPESVFNRQDDPALFKVVKVLGTT